MDDHLTGAYGRFVHWLPSWLTAKVPRDHWESDTAFRHRRRVTAVTAVAGASLLGVSLSTKPDSKEFYGLTLGVAGTWVAVALASGPLHLGYQETRDRQLERPVVTPVLLGVGAFGVFYAAALVARTVPFLDRALRDILQFADEGTFPLVLATTLANGGGARRCSSAARSTRRPASTPSSSRPPSTRSPRWRPATPRWSWRRPRWARCSPRSAGRPAGSRAPLLTHLTWSTLMARFPAAAVHRSVAGVKRNTSSSRRRRVRGAGAPAGRFPIRSIICGYAVSS